MAPARDLLSLVGSTPMLELTHFDTGPCKLFVKLESHNPGGSIKDRMALSMIEAAEREGRIRPGALMFEATAGNTGLGLALVAAAKGYRLSLVIPDKMAREKILHLRALGASVFVTRSDVGKGHPEYYQDLAQRLAHEQGGYFVNQFANPANPLAHETSTGPEIWAQMAHDLDAVVCGVGSGGTLTGVGRFFRRAAPQVKMVLADPEGSVLAEYVRTGKLRQAGSWLVEGIGEDFIPENCEIGLVREAYSIADEESLGTARDLLKLEGILAGSSSGTLVAAALRYCRAQSRPQRVVTFVCDSGNKYLSKMFDDRWMRDQGMLHREAFGDLRDLIPMLHQEGGTVVAGPDDTLLTAYGRMKQHDVSQLPVMSSSGELLGIVDESDLLVAVRKSSDGFRQPVSSAMTTGLETLEPTAPVDALVSVFERGHVAVVAEGPRLVGLITRMDLLQHLRKSVGSQAPEETK